MNLPNRITLGRLFVALLFFFALGYYRLQVEFNWQPLGLSERLVLNVALALFFVAVITDALDGYLARKLGQVTTFGRIADPFVDKVVICGAFVFLAAMHKQLGDLVWPSMVVVILGRELLVTSLRGLAEARGVDFGASVFGKIKMAVQSFTVGWVLLVRANIWTAEEGPDVPDWNLDWGGIVAVVLIWITLAVTLASGVEALLRARRVLLDEA